MKTTFDLPEPLLRKAKAAAAHQGRPLRDLVAEALDEKLRQSAAAPSASPAELPAWKAYAAKLQRLPDGSYFNPDGIEDEGFFQTLDAIRAEAPAWPSCDPFAGE